MVNIFICGMGGQGIAFLSKVLAETCLEAGHTVRTCDTHGMTQRGGTVESHLRLGKQVFSPIIPKGNADLIVGLERLESMRAMQTMSAEGSTVIYYNSVYQPASVRTGKNLYPEEKDFTASAKKQKIRVINVISKSLTNAKMQNTVLLAKICSEKLINRVNKDCILKVMNRLLPEHLKKMNIGLFTSHLQNFLAEKNHV